MFVCLLNRTYRSYVECVRVVRNNALYGLNACLVQMHQQPVDNIVDNFTQMKQTPNVKTSYYQ